MGQTIMMKVYLKTKQGETVGRVPETNLLHLLDRMKRETFIRLEDPVTVNILQAPISNDKGEIQLVDGSYVPQHLAQQAGPENLMLRNILRLAAMSVEEVFVRSNEIIQVRELSTAETEEYNKGIQSAKLASSGIDTSNIELPESLK